jgi:hypothetical protein
MKTKLLLPTDDKKVTMSMRLPLDLRKQAEKLAKDNRTTLTHVIESALVLLMKKVEDETSKS